MIKFGEYFKKRQFVIAISSLIIIVLIGSVFLASGWKFSLYKSITPKAIEISTTEGMIVKELNNEQGKRLEKILEYEKWERDYLSHINGLKISTMNVISYGEEKIIWIYEISNDPNLFFSVGPEKGEIYKAPKYIWINILDFAQELKTADI